MDKRFQVFQRMKINNSIKEFEMDNDDKKYIPALRFPEFQNNGKWTTKLIGDIANTFSGGTPSVGNNNYYGGNIPFIRSGEIAKKDTELYITELGLSSSSAKMVNKGTILYALYGATSGEVAISQIDGAINQAILAIIPKENLYYNKYIYYFLQYQKQNILSKYLQGGQGNLSGAIINNLVIVLPCDANNDISFDEQKRIADCLSSLDKHIDATKRKLDQLKEHKKGVMQRIFPTKGKTIPELRFSKFKGKWIEKKLGQMCHLTNGMAFKPSDWKEKGIPIVRIQNLNDENASFNYCDPDIIDNKYMIDTGTLLFSWSGTPGTSFGAYIWNRGKAVLNQHIFIVKTLGIDKIFFKMIIDANMASIIEKSHGGAGLRHITKTELENIKVFVSEDDIEQRKIASFLLSMDNIISVYTNKLNLLVEYKKGLMQQLFPKL